MHMESYSVNYNTPPKGHFYQMKMAIMFCDILYP